MSAFPMEVDYEAYLPPPSRTVYQKCRTFIYDSDTGSVFGRTGINWAKILFFYFAFYTMLAAVFAGCFWVFFLTMDPRIPKWQLDESRIGTSPGMGFRPMPPVSTTENVLIWYKAGDSESYKFWTNTVENFLEVYRNPGLTAGRGENIHTCDYDSPPGKGQVCHVDVTNWFPCTVQNKFNYPMAAPCIFVKLNKIYNWVPVFYNDSTNLPESMPTDLKEYIKQQEKDNPKSMNTVWVSCGGEYPADNENIGPIRYYPRQGFPGYFFPYVNTEGYLSPLVAVHFVRPKTGVLIHIECKAWAYNILQNRPFKAGTLHIELQID